MRYLSKVAIAIPLFLSVAALAKTDKDAGKALFDDARRRSDIRAESAPAFRMEANFRITPKNAGKEINGRYTEIWFLHSKWRREIEAGSFHRIEIGAAPKKWFLDSGEDRPEPAFYGPLVLLFSRNSTLNITGISDRQPGGVNATCVESKTQWSKDIDCVDPKAGVFLLRETLLGTGFNPVHHSCVYGNYEMFGEHLFPRTVRCNNSPGNDIELTITKLEVAPSTEEGLFTKPEGAIETADCQGRATPPHVDYSPDPLYPEHHKEIQTVVLWLIVDTDGTPKDVRVARTAGNDFDRPAVEVVRRWRFKPSTCDGVPVPVQINVEITFRKF